MLKKRREQQAKDKAIAEQSRPAEKYPPAQNKRAPAKQIKNMFDFEGMSDDQIGQASSEEEEMI